MVAVKKLEWIEHWSGYDGDQPCWRGKNPLGLIIYVDFFETLQLEKHADAPAEELAAKKAAAQAYYETRIMSALLPAQSEPDAGRVEGWRPIETAPKDGTIVNVVGRYRDAISGYPRYAGFSQGMWREYSRFDPQPLICWAWRPRGEWPMEPTPPSPPREEIEHQGVVAVGVKG